jgi:hypothetical protein
MSRRIYPYLPDENHQIIDRQSFWVSPHFWVAIIFNTVAIWTQGLQLNANSHMHCRAPAVLRPRRSESDLSRPRHSTAGAKNGMCELTSAVCRRPVGDLASFGFFRLLSGHSRRLLTRMLLPFGMCLIVLITTEIEGETECELTLKLKPVFLLLLC